MSSNNLDDQCSVISNSIKTILEFTLNRTMKMRCFQLLQVENTYTFTQELKSKLLQLGSSHPKIIGQTYYDTYRSQISINGIQFENSGHSSTQSSSEDTQKSQQDNTNCHILTDSDNMNEIFDAVINNLSGASQKIVITENSQTAPVQKEKDNNAAVLSSETFIQEFINDLELCKNL